MDSLLLQHVLLYQESITIFYFLSIQVDKNILITQEKCNPIFDAIFVDLETISLEEEIIYPSKSFSLM